MKVIIFAGGHGTRLWPLSRKNSPKQFEKIFNSKSTLEMAVERVQDLYGIENIYISTNKDYADEITEIVNTLPEENLFLEPEKKDVAAAIALSLQRLDKSGYKGPISILWADHLMENIGEFQKALIYAEELISKNPRQIIMLGEKPRFPNNNIGWIKVGESSSVKDNQKIYPFKELKYRPPIEECEIMIHEGRAFWNPGYFITDLDFLMDLFNEHVKSLWDKIREIDENEKNITKKYSQIEPISFDDAVLTKIKPEQAQVIGANMLWSDPGTLYAMKEALTDSEDENYIEGEAIDIDSRDALIINKDDERLVTSIGLDGVIIINTKDTILVVDRNSSHRVKELVQKLSDSKYKDLI